MSTHRPPRSSGQVLADAARVQRTGGERFTRSASPIPEVTSAVSRALGSVGSVTEGAFQRDAWTLAAAGAQTKTLTYLPVPGSEHVYLNGIEQDEDTDWTRSDQALSVLTAMDARVSDRLEARYAYLTGVPAMPSEELPDAALYLALNEASGATAADSSGNGHNGEYGGTPGFGAASLRADGANSAVTFSGDDVVNVPWNTWMDAPQITIEAFIKTSVTSISVIVSRDQFSLRRLWHFRVTEAGKLQFEVIDPAVVDFTSSTSVNDNVRHHVAVVVDGATVKLYIDGALDTSTTYTTALGAAALGAPRLTVGAALASSQLNHLFVGVIDEVGYYTQALPAADIAALAAR